MIGTDTTSLFGHSEVPVTGVEITTYCEDWLKLPEKKAELIQAAMALADFRQQTVYITREDHYLSPGRIKEVWGDNGVILMTVTPQVPEPDAPKAQVVTSGTPQA